jgi:hypothetical protein
MLDVIFWVTGHGYDHCLDFTIAINEHFTSKHHVHLGRRMGKVQIGYPRAHLVRMHSSHAHPVLATMKLLTIYCEFMACINYACDMQTVVQFYEF